jgi:hypothetical protein
VENGYFVNTTCGAVTVTLPATPSAGDIISIADYASTFQTNNVTLCRNGNLKLMEYVQQCKFKYTRSINYTCLCRCYKRLEKYNGFNF